MKVLESTDITLDETVTAGSWNSARDSVPPQLIPSRRDMISDALASSVALSVMSGSVSQLTMGKQEMVPLMYSLYFRHLL